MGQGNIRVNRPRRRLVAAAALAGCAPGSAIAQAPLTRIQRALGLASEPPLQGQFVGPDQQLGHLLRADSPAAALPRSAQTTRHVAVAIVGGGVAGLAAARALRGAGVDSYRIFELDRGVGGNSRGGSLAGFACPWGAHYLPVPDLDAAASTQTQGPGSDHADMLALVRELGLLQGQGADARYAETALCHAPQERLLFNGRWQSGLLPLDGLAAASLAQYRRFSELIAGFARSGAFQIPSITQQPVLARISFAAWLDQNGLNDRYLRWYLDYCCRDDYGAPSALISAWAGIHYFASRHGFELHGADSGNEPTGEPPAQLLTWPAGNSWLIEKMAQPHRDQTLSRAAVLRIEHTSSGKSVLQVWRADENRSERWSADFVILATPLFIAARLLAPVPAALAALLPKLRYSVWQVANVHVPQPPPEKDGAPPSWDNVVFGQEALGYVDATHQLLRGHRQGAIWTCYRAIGIDAPARRRFYEQDWHRAAQGVLDDLRPAYPDIERYARQVDIVRWGHGMIVPTPGLHSDEAFVALRAGKNNSADSLDSNPRVVLAHSDLAGYSVFEEAFAIGTRAGRQIAQALSGSPTQR